MPTNQLPVPQSPICDPKTGQITIEWYLFLSSFFQSTVSQSGTAVSDAQRLIEQQRSDTPEIDNLGHRISELEALLNRYSDSPAIDRLNHQFGELATLLQAQGNTSISEDLVNRMAVLEMLLQAPSVFPVLEKMQQRINELESLLLAAQ